MLSSHRDAIEADLARFYGVRLTDLYTGRLTLRRFFVLVSQLPDDSAYRRSVLGHAEASWGVAEHLLASVVDSLQIANWQRSKDGQRGSRAPKPMPRPTDPPKLSSVVGRRSTRSRSEVIAMLASLAHGREEHAGSGSGEVQAP